jgi:hypothetical protein
LVSSWLDKKCSPSFIMTKFLFTFL